MTYVLSITSFLAAVAGVAEPPFIGRCLERPQIVLKSAYSDAPLVDGARQIGLTFTLDEKGNGTGTLTLDPNRTNGLFSTAIAVRTVSVRVRLVEEHAGKGRWLYELTRDEPQKGTGTQTANAPDRHPERWLLVRPIKGGTPCWLMTADKDGKFGDAVMME